MKLIIWFARNPVAANFLMLIIVAGGLLGLAVSERYTVPPAPQNQIQIEIAYPGSSPAEVERALCIPIEEAIHDLAGIRHINTTAYQAGCEIFAEFDPTIDPPHFQASIQARMERIPSLPRGAEKLTVREVKTDTSAVIVMVYGEVDRMTLLRQRDQLRAMLNKHPGIGELFPHPLLPYEISIEITESDLRRYALSFEEVAAAIQSASGNISAGELKKTDEKLLLSSKGQAMSVADYAAINLRTDSQGASLLLGDIAQIHETAGEKDLLIRIDGKPAMQIIVRTKGRIVDTVEAVNEVIAAYRPALPDSVGITTWDDWSKYYQENMSMLMSSAFFGFLLILLVLTLTMRFHLALWAGCGILISVLGALWVMPMLGISLNTYSIAALIMVLGIVVDDAVIVSENVYTHEQQGRVGLSGVITGTLEVAPLVVLMILSTMIAFIPGMFLPGLSGYLMYNIAAVVVLVLAFSMLETLFILPAHLAMHAAPAPKRTYENFSLERLRTKADAALHGFIDKVYVPVLKKLLRFRYIALSTSVILLLIIWAFVLSGRIQSVMDAPVNDYYLVAMLEHPAGTPLEEVDYHVKRLEQIADNIRLELNSEFGAGPSAALKDSFQHVIAASDDYTGFVNIELAIDERIRAKVDEITQQWQTRFGELPVGATLSFQTFWPRNLGIASPQSAKAIELKLIAADSALQSAAGEALKIRLAAYAGVHSVTGSMQAGKPELNLYLKPEAAAYGLTLQSLGEQVRNGFFGLEVQRFFQGREEIRVMTRFPAEHRRSLDDLYRMPIRLPNGKSVPFAVIAEAEYTPGFASITRHNRERIQLISAEVYKDRANVETILADLRTHVIPVLEKQYPGLKIEPGQTRQKQEEAMSNLWGYGAFAVLAIYALLAVPLRSYIQPLMIMLAIPFGFIGAVLGHLLLKIPLSLESYVAMFAVGGIVINNSLILMARINTLQQTVSIYKAVILAGKARFRAIFLTAITTFLGLLPLISEQSSDAEKILPMAVTLAFGILFSTLVTLLLVPINCVIYKEITGWRSNSRTVRNLS